MGFRDAQIDRIRKRIWLTADILQAVDWITGVGWETAGITPAEVTNVGMGTWIMTDGEFLNGYILCPYDLDPKFDIGFKVAYTLDHDGAGAATVSWILLQDAIAEGSAIALPSTALDTVIGLLDSYGAGAVTDFLLAITGRGVRSAANIGLTRAQIETGAFLTFKLEMDAAVNETTVRFIGLIMDYVPQMCEGVGREIDAPLKADGSA